MASGSASEGPWWKQQQQSKSKTYADTGRAARLEKAQNAHSLHDVKELPAGLDKASKEETKDLAHMLKSFYVWMMQGPAKKSAGSYVNTFKVLMREHDLSMKAYSTKEYITFVKGCRENLKGNGIFSAAVRQLHMWFEARGSVEGPWEEQASLSDKLFDPRHCGGRRNPDLPLEPSKPVGDAIKDLFSCRRPVKSEEGDGEAKPVTTSGAPSSPLQGQLQTKSITPTKDAKGKARTSSASGDKVTPQKGAAPRRGPRRAGRKAEDQTEAASSSTAATPIAAQKPAPSGGESAPREEAGEDKPAAKRRRGPALRAVSAAVARARKAKDAAEGATAGRSSSAAPAMGKKRGRPPAAEKSSEPKDMEESKAPAESKRGRPGASPSAVKKRPVPKAEAEGSKATASETGDAQTQSVGSGSANKGPVDKKELGRQHQLADLMKLARSHVQRRDFQRAEQVVTLIVSFCDQEGLERPVSLLAKKEEGSPEQADDMQAAEEAPNEAPKGDELEVARDALRRCFSIRGNFANAAAEDDAEVIPAPKKAAPNARKKRADAEDEDDAMPQAEDTDAAAKFAAIAEAEPTDYVRLHAVAAAFREHLRGSGLDEAAAEDAKRAFLELFQLDDKGFDGMAGAEYVALASAEDKRHGDAAASFAAFWKTHRDQAISEPPARLPTSEERNLAAENGVPPSWRLQVFHRVKREDLVVLTAPDGTHEFTTKSGLRNMAVLDEAFLAEKRKAEERGLREEEAKLSAAASLARRRAYAEERKRFVAEGLRERAAACKRFEAAFARISHGEGQEGSALQGALPVDCIGTYMRLDEPFEGRPSYERLTAQGVQRSFLFHCRGRWVVAGALDADAQPFAYVEDNAQLPYEVDRDGSPWMVPASAEEGGGFEEVRGAPVWCAHLSNDELLRRAFKVLRCRRECCPGCGVHPSGEQQNGDELDDLEGKTQRLKWESYDDVPNATPEEREQYPGILKKFHEEGYPYLTGVRKLMARYGKAPSAMATKEFHVLVRNDPMNAVCNGFDSSAVLYFIMFWDKWGSGTFPPLKKKTTAEMALMPTQERNAFLRDFARYDVDGRDAYEIKEQGAVLADLQIDMPLTRLIADVTSEWKKDLKEFLTPSGFLETDADASGLRAIKVGADLLPEPTKEEWALWGGALKAFDSWKVGGKGGRTLGHNRSTEHLNQMVQLHGKSPAVVATERYATIVVQELGKDSAAAAAVAAFAEFWKERQGTKMPDPSRGLLFGAQLPSRLRVPPLDKVNATIRVRRALGLPASWDLELEPSFKATEPADEGGRVFHDEAALREELRLQLEARQNEQRRKNAVALEWNLPPRYEVEFEEDGTPYVMSPDGDVRYDSPEDVPRPTWMGEQEKKYGSRVSRGGGRGSGKGAGRGGAGFSGGLDKDMVAAAYRLDFAEVWRLQNIKEHRRANPKAYQQPKQQTSATEEKTETPADEKEETPQGADAEMPDAGAEEEPAAQTQPQPTGKSPGARGSVTCEARCRAGKMPLLKKGDPASQAPVTRKYTKQVGLKQQQEKQIENGELMLLAHCWRLVGVRGEDGSIVPLGDCKDTDPSKVTCVLAQIASEITKAEQERIRSQWGIDENWQVLVRTRLTGSQVTVISPEGRSFFKKTQIDTSKRIDSKRKQQIEEAASLEELLQILRGIVAKSTFEVAGATGSAADLNGVYRQCQESLPELRFVKCCKALASSGSPVEVRLVENQWRFTAEGSATLALVNSASPPFQSDAPLVPAEGTDGELLAQCGIKLLDSNHLASRVVGTLSSQNPLKTCRICISPSAEGKGRGGRNSNNADSKLGQREEFEARLRDLGARRQDAPRSLGAMARHMTQKLIGIDPNAPKAILRFLAGAGSGTGVVRLGTLCSGTDSPTIALKHLVGAVDALVPGATEQKFRLEHVFSCEFDEAKQGFLLKNFSNMGYLFSDCTHMGRRRAWDVKSGSVQNIPGDLDLLVAGFSCKDLSFMNSYRKTLEEMGTSGRTLRGCFDYVERYRPRVVLLENVYAIDRADQHGLKQVNIVMEGLRARGYVAGYTLMNSCDYYLPQIRHRIWMWGFRMDVQPVASETTDAVRERAFERGQHLNPRMQALLKLLEEPSALHFDDLLLDEDDARVHEYNRQLYSKARRRQGKKGNTEEGRFVNAKLTWQQKYTMHRMKLDYAQERPYTSERGAQWKGMLNERTMELLDLKCLDVMNEQSMDPREVPMLWDLLQSVERVPGSRVRRDRQNYATCILPPSLLWHTVRHRYILGQEKLALQGIFEEDLTDITSFSQVLLSDLAGNAFTSTVCLACMLAASALADEATMDPSTMQIERPLALGDRTEETIANNNKDAEDEQTAKRPRTS